MIKLFESAEHQNIMFDELSSGEMVQANQHFIIHNGHGMVLDPGGHKVYPVLSSKMEDILPPDGLKFILFSHQDPDILAAANGWLMTTNAQAMLSKLWIRFIPHFGVDELVLDRIFPLPDEGGIIDLHGAPVKIVPAHLLHSAGNFQVYDPISKILYSGDLGASLGQDYSFIENFENHIQYMEGFHRRYMPSTKAMKMWAKMARTLDIDMIAPQHGAVMKGKDMVAKFIDWVDNLEVGIDFLGEFIVP